MTPWTVTHQAPLSMEFSRQEYWSGLPFPFSGHLPSPEIEPRSPALQADSLLSEPPEESMRQEEKTRDLFCTHEVPSSQSRIWEATERDISALRTPRSKCPSAECALEASNWDLGPVAVLVTDLLFARRSALV